MGFLRLYLALCVVHAHTGNFIPWAVPSGRQAVQMFFIISGFYMGMILDGRYKNIRDFYASRWLRIAVPFYFHAAAIVLVSVAVGLLTSRWLAVEAYASQPFLSNGPAGIILAAITNLTIFGQDLVLFFQDPAGSGLQFTTNYALGSAPLYRYLIIPQCWSISLELCFYALAPLLAGLRSSWLAVVIFASLAARLFAYQVLGLDHDPWNYRFLPFELLFFALGLMAWRIYALFRARWKVSGRPGPLAYAVIIFAVVACGYLLRRGQWFLGLSWGPALAELFLVACTVPLIVLAFHVTSRHGIDRATGELCYPIYLNHLFIIVALRSFPEWQPLASWFGLITGITATLLAWVFWYFFQRAFDERRHVRFGLAGTPS
ncbi:MAG: hypothetical protein Fur0032_01720 [Terrimicrobiaceae bacterium]